MAPKTKSGIHWTNLELKGLLEDEDSCVYLERAQKHLGLHPIHLNDLNGSLREMLNEKLNFYDSELNGLVLAYRNPKILSPYGETLYDSCYIHIDIEADFYVFRPEIGRSLKGYVNKKSTNHIGILVHKAFNVSIPRPDGDELNDDDWPGHQVRVGQEIRFTPGEIDFQSRLPYIRGSLHEGEFLNGCQLFNEQIASTYELEFQETSKRGFSQDIPNKTIVKKENKRIVFNSDNDSEVEVDPDSGSEKKPSIKKLQVPLDSTQDSADYPLKKKKRKSTPARELGTDSKAEKSDDSIERPKKRKRNASPSETEDERAEKSKIKKLSQIDHFSETKSTIDSPKKKHKKKSKNYLDFDTEDERNHKAEIRNLTNNLSQRPADNDELLMDTEDERQHKSYLKGLVEAMENNGTEVSEEHVKSKKEKKSRKNSVICNELVNGEFDEVNGFLGAVVKNEEEQEEKKKLKKKHKHKREKSVNKEIQ